MSPLRGIISVLLAAVAFAAAIAPLPAHAHGERATEPYIRTRTIQWYDLKWSADKINVNDTVTVTGKFHLMKDWPDSVAEPDLIFMSNASPGAVLTRVESYINDMPAQQSLKDLELDRDYTFKLVMQGRIPGRWHLHPMINVAEAGPIVGPGGWVEVTGNAADFRHAVKTLDGRTIEDTQNYGVARVQMWQGLYILIAVAWLLWWLKRPLLIPRWLANQQGREDLLVTRTDDKVAIGFLVTVLVIVIIGYKLTTKEYPHVVPLQAGTRYVEPLPQQPNPVTVKFRKAEYDVPGRSLRMMVEVTNSGDRPVRLGELTTASLRFINQSVPAAVQSVDADYPKDLIAGNGIIVETDTPLAPGETRMIKVDATDAAWEVERLVSFVTNVDSRLGALLFFYDDKGNRHIRSVAGPIMPVFKSTM